MEDFAKPEEGKSYVIVYDTFGEGLTANPGDFGEVEIFHSKEELDCGIVEAYYRAEDMLNMDVDEDSKVSKLALESVVICEVVNMEGYAREVVTQYMQKERERDYQTYLKLKERFDSSSD